MRLPRAPLPRKAPRPFEPLLPQRLTERSVFQHQHQCTGHLFDIARIHAEGGIAGDLASRRGIVTGTEVKQHVVTVAADVPLAEMFGYATDLRSATQGKGTFTMEFACYKPVPRDVQEEIVAARRKELAAKK